MPRRISFLSILLVLAMTAAALTPWAAAASGGLALVTSSQEATSQTVGFTGVPEDCQSLQVTLTLSQSGPSYDFALDGSLAALPGVHAAFQQEGNRVTVYVTLRTGTLTDSGSLTLGTLSTPGTSFSVTGFSDSKLLGADSGELDAGTSDSGSSSGNGSSSSGGQTSGNSGSSADDDDDLWAIQVDRPTGGTLTASRSQSASGRTITLTAVPDEGCALQEVTAVTSAGKSLSLTKQKDGTYTFTMPSAKVTVSAAFTPQSQTEGEGEAPLPFTDVASDAWYAQAVAYVYRQGLMSGTAQDQFSPDLTTNRAMLVTILYRLTGSPAVDGGSAFNDVASGDWYASGVAWASANGIVTGYGDGRFGPNAPITREQMAAILYRYAGFAGQSTTGQADLSGYTDAGQVSPYAAEAMGWAVDQGLITGVSAGTLAPGGSATRAQVATILMRICELAQN
ncbi:S-layer homology domain-containing protein [Intestinimonas aquisgranensis]|nr:S-layer homology domain-containing protein [Intestinimonas aquisgranensis]